MQVPVGKTTVGGTTITLIAYATAIVAVIQGARDEATIMAVIVGTVSLVTVLGGRYAQAVAAYFTDRSSWGTPRRSQHVPSEAEIGAWPTASTTTEPRPTVSMTNPDPAYINSIPAGSVPLEGGQ